MSYVAPLRGTTFLYCHLPASQVMIQKDNYRYTIANYESFNYLYFELDATRAALKMDCVEYAIYQPDEPLCCYPDWFIEAYDNGYIYDEEEYEDLIFYCEYGDIVMTPGSVVIRNFKGELNYMERHEFDKHFEIVED